MRRCGTCIKVKPKPKKGKKSNEKKAKELPFEGPILKHKKMKVKKQKKSSVMDVGCNYNMNPEAVENKLRPMGNQRKKDTEYTPSELLKHKTWFPKESNYSIFLKTMKKGRKH